MRPKPERIRPDRPAAPAMNSEPPGPSRNGAWNPPALAGGRRQWHWLATGRLPPRARATCSATAIEPFSSSRAPKLLQPRPNADTSRPQLPSVCMSTPRIYQGRLPARPTLLAPSVWGARMETLVAGGEGGGAGGGSDRGAGGGSPRLEAAASRPPRRGRRVESGHRDYTRSTSAALDRPRADRLVHDEGRLGPDPTRRQALSLIQPPVIV